MIPVPAQMQFAKSGTRHPNIILRGHRALSRPLPWWISRNPPDLGLHNGAVFKAGSAVAAKKQPMKLRLPVYAQLFYQ